MGLEWDQGELHGRQQWTVWRHDQFQFEVKLGYDLHRHLPRERYRVGSHFFIPENLDINGATIRKTNSIRDLLLYIRFRTPDFTLSTLTDMGSDRSPLTGVASRLVAARHSPTAENIQALDYEMRLLGCVFKNSLRLQARDIVSLLQNPDGSPTLKDASQTEALLKEFEVHVKRVSSRFRALRRFSGSAPHQRIGRPPTPLPTNTSVC